MASYNHFKRPPTVVRTVRTSSLDVRTVRTILEKVGFSAQRYGFKLLSKTRNFHQVVYNFHRIVLKAQNLERLKMSEIFIPTYFIIGAIWWAFRLGFAHDGSEIILLAPSYSSFLAA